MSFVSINIFVVSIVALSLLLCLRHFNDAYVLRNRANFKLFFIQMNKKYTYTYFEKTTYRIMNITCLKQIFHSGRRNTIYQILHCVQRLFVH